jgi:hypothetical protein
MFGWRIGREMYFAAEAHGAGVAVPARFLGGGVFRN